ncbi:hypothetical protein [Nonomuraea sp. SYSU D8015]|uniref:hypothetical protein n=1 Tax=Nonomuraea sp. SYSU D8015 TaxID=2593644 RepID=UPI001660ED01|nr:hypothetical protein [Nonomuraea sp. SYSU D8015]
MDVVIRVRLNGFPEIADGRVLVQMQTIEAAVHRWDAENAIGAACPIPEEVAVDAVARTFQVMALARRARTQTPAGPDERYRFRHTDGLDRHFVPIPPA